MMDCISWQVSQVRAPYSHSGESLESLTLALESTMWNARCSHAGYLLTLFWSTLGSEKRETIRIRSLDSDSDEDVHDEANPAILDTIVQLGQNVHDEI